MWRFSVLETGVPYVFGPKCSIVDKFRESVHTGGWSFDIMWRNWEFISYGR